MFQLRQSSWSIFFEREGDAHISFILIIGMFFLGGGGTRRYLIAHFYKNEFQYRNQRMLLLSNHWDNVGPFVYWLRMRVLGHHHITNKQNQPLFPLLTPWRSFIITLLGKIFLFMSFASIIFCFNLSILANFRWFRVY